MGPAPPARWHCTQLRARIGAMSFVNVTALGSMPKSAAARMCGSCSSPGVWDCAVNPVGAHRSAVAATATPIAVIAPGMSPSKAWRWIVMGRFPPLKRSLEPSANVPQGMVGRTRARWELPVQAGRQASCDPDHAPNCAKNCADAHRRPPTLADATDARTEHFRRWPTPTDAKKWVPK